MSVFPIACLRMDNGWEASANAWIADMGERGDFGRRYILDPIMLPKALARGPKKALDVGCGEGRFCRMLKQHNVEVTGVDPTPRLLEAARRRDPRGTYLQAAAECLPFDSDGFDLVISYLTLIDIPDFEAAIAEMARVLAPGGALLIANLNSFNTAGFDAGWMNNYLDPRSMWTEYRGIRVQNHHRPLSMYMRALLDAGLRLAHFDEPSPRADTPLKKAASYRRNPWFLVMEWVKDVR
jgi:SAM-dependent methyltransferase